MGASQCNMEGEWHEQSSRGRKKEPVFTAWQWPVLPGTQKCSGLGYKCRKEALNGTLRHLCCGWKAVGRHLMFLSKGSSMIRIKLWDDKPGGSIYDEL